MRSRSKCRECGKQVMNPLVAKYFRGQTFCCEKCRKQFEEELKLRGIMI